MGVDLEFTHTATHYPYMKHGAKIIAKGETLKDIPSGDSVHAIAWIKNTGSTGGYATVQIYNITDSKYEAGSSKVWVSAGGEVQKSCSMTMPDHNVNIKLQAIWEESATKRWIHDTESTFYLKIKAVTPPKIEFTHTATHYPYMKHGAKIIAKGETLKDIPGGDSVHAIAWIKNSGGAGGYATVQIYNITDSKYEAGSSKVWIPAGGEVQKSCSMTMPGHNVNIKLQAIWEESATKRWIQDTESTFYLKIKEVTGVDLEFTHTATHYPYMKHGTTLIAKGETLKDIPSGDSVHAIAWIKNTGGTGGYARLKIYNKTKAKYEAESSKVWIPAGGEVQKSCSMTMPGYNVTIVLHAICEETIHDTEGRFYLKIEVMKDTEIDSFDVQDISGVSVRKLYVGHSYQWKAFLYEYKLIGHGDPIKGRKIEIKRTDTGALLFAGNTQADGGIVGSWTTEDKHKGKYKVQAKFTGDSAYNSCESGKFDIEVATAPERGVEVVVKNVPGEGLKVLIAPYGMLIPFVCAWTMKTEKTIYSDLESVMFDLTGIVYKGITKACIQVKSMSDELMDELKAEPLPTTGTTTKHMDGYLGCPYRTWLGVSPRTPAPGKSFTLTAHLIKNPKETVGKDFEVNFYEVVDKTEEKIGANLTNEKGQAVFTTSKAELGTYTYIARYSGGDTFAELATVTVSAVPPCPIEEAFREVCPLMVVYGCVLHPDLVTLRAFRDAVLPRIVVKAYYAAGPFIIILFVNNRVSKWFVRKMVHIVAQRLRKRWSY